MTEAEWLKSSGPSMMLEWLKGRRIKVRKLRLFAASCGRRLWDWLTDERSKAAITALEEYADSPGKQADKDRLQAAWRGAAAAQEEDQRMTPDAIATRAASAASEPCDAHWAARWGLSLTLDTARAWKRSGERKALAGILRDVVGNPRAKLAFDTSLRSPEIQGLAQATYDNRSMPSGELDLLRLAVLADALEEAGCIDDAILIHLRSPGPHVRGCWALDLILGKADA